MANNEDRFSRDAAQLNFNIISLLNCRIFSAAKIANLDGLMGGFNHAVFLFNL